MTFNDSNAGRLRSIAESLELSANITWDGDENMSEAGYLKRIEEAAAALGLPPVQLLDVSGAAVSHTGDTNETALATIPIAAGLMDINDRLEISGVFTFPNSANIKTLRVRLGGIAGTIFKSFTPTTTTQIDFLTHITNRGAQDAQVGPPAGQIVINQSIAASVVTGAIDMSEAQDLVITAQLASAGETITLQSRCVKLIRAA